MIRFKKFIIEGTKLWYSFSDVPKSKSPLYKFISDLNKFLSKDQMSFVYFDDSYDYSSTKKALLIKVTDSDILHRIGNNFQVEYDLQTNTGNDYISKGEAKFKLALSGGIRGTGMLPRKGSGSSIPSTAQQESGTIEYFLGAFKGKAPTLQEINKKIGFEFDAAWFWNFQEQYRAFASNIGNLSTHKIYLDSAKNDSDIIVSLAKKFGLKDSKDNWNPADIWIMNKTTSQIKSETKKISSLEEYNAYILEQYNNKSIIGVSLKKVNEGKAAKFKIVSVNDIPIVELKLKRVLFDPLKKNFILETTGNINGFNIRVGYKSKTVRNPKDIAIFLEGRMKGTTVQLGAVSKKSFIDITKKHGFDIKSKKRSALSKPGVYSKKNIKRIMSNPVVSDSRSSNKLPDDSLLLAKSDVMCIFLDSFLLSKDISNLLKESYYSATKTNSFSSIHCKIF